MGPAGNQQGEDWFMSLTSGSRIRRNHWTKIPMSSEVIARVNVIGVRQKMPTKITYANRYGHEIEGTIDELGHDSSDDDSSYSALESDDNSDSGNDSYESDDDDSDGDSDDSDSDDDNDEEIDSDGDNDDNQPAHNVDLTLPPPPDNMDPNPIINVGQQPPHFPAPHAQPPEQPIPSRQQRVQVHIPQPHRNTGVEHSSTGVTAQSDNNTGVDNDRNNEPAATKPLHTHGPTTPIEPEDSDEVPTESPTRITESDRIAAAEQADRDRTASNTNDARPVRKKRGQLKDNGYTHLLDSPIAEHNHQFSLIDLISTGDPTKYSSLSGIDHWMNQSLI